MNSILRELKSHRNSLIFWSIGMVALIGSSMAKYAAYQTTGQSMTNLMAQFPKMIQTVFGINGFDLSKASGYYGVIYMYITLMAGIHAVLLGSDLISKEERDKTSEFLFVKPISRTSAVTAKLIAGVLNLIVFNLVTTISSIYLVDYFNKGESVNHEILILTIGLFFLQLIFFSIGTMMAGINKKPKAVGGAATSILLVTFFLSFLVNLSDKLENLKYLTPFKYFDAKSIVASNKLDLLYIVLSLTISAIFLIGTYYFYDDRDLSV
jgi:ABC-2 type transport system permease protein